MTFYIDLIYIVCVVMNFIALKFHASFLSISVKPKRLIFGAMLAGLISIWSVVFGINHILIIIETLFVLRFVYGKCEYPELIRRFFILFGIVLVFGAVMNLFSVFFCGAFLKDGRFYGVLPAYVFVLGTAVSSMLLWVFLFFVKHRRMLYTVELIIDDEIVKTTALLDTGNRLLEPKSRRPVIIIESAVLKAEHEKSSIFLKTAGCEKESMDMVYVKALTLLEENRSFENLYAGVIAHTLSKNGEFHALLHSDFAK